jgi:hypothetical protein
VEKDGKRSIKIVSDYLFEGGVLKKDPDPKVVATLDYSFKADEMMVKGGVIRKIWAGFDVDLTRAITFKAAGV